MKTIITKFRDMPLRQKLFACIVAFIILPLTIILVIINNYFANRSIYNSLEISFQNLKQTDESFKSLINEVDSLSVRVLSNDTVQNLLYSCDNNQNYDEEIIQINQWMQNELYYSQNLDSIIIYTKEETFWFGNNLNIKRDAYLEGKAISLKGVGFWSHAHRAGAAGSDRLDVITFYRAINNMNILDRNLAVELLMLNENRICQLYSKLNSYKGGQIYLIGNDGRIISSTNKEIIGKEYKNEAFEKSLKTKGEAYIYDDSSNQGNIILYYTISKTGWRLVQTIPRSSFVLLANTINAAIFIAIILCVIFGIFFSFVQNRVVLKPLKYLLKEMEKLRKGNFNVELTTNSNDEVGRIIKEYIEIINQLKELVNLVYLSKMKQKEAELMALEAQINPHFLYNTLDSVHWLAVKDKNFKISEQIEALSEMFRHVLHNGKEIVTIKEELDFLNNYIFLQQAKYGNRIKFEVHADPELYYCATPKLILQPLVENSVLHGLETKLGGGKVEVLVRRELQGIKMTVTDNGIGTDGCRINSMMNEKEESHNVFALRNIDERIKIKYGEMYGLKFFSEKEKGARVEVLIPMISKERE